jgi:hypothetical protein
MKGEITYASTNFISLEALASPHPRRDRRRALGLTAVRLESAI